MKTAFLKLFDTFTDGIVAVLVAVSTAGLSGIWILLTTFQNYIAANIMEYLLIAFFSMVGQTSMWFIKFRYPSMFGKHELEFGKNSNGTLFLYWFIDCALSGICGALFTKYTISFIFLTLSFVQGADSISQPTDDFHKVIVAAFLVGMFYEIFIKKALKKKKEIENN